MTRVKKQKEKNKMNHKKIVTFLTITALATSGPLTFYNDINTRIPLDFCIKQRDTNR